MLLNPFQLHQPRNMTEASRLLEELESVKILSGGTFLMNSLKSLKKKNARTPEHVISLGQVPELKGISVSDHHLTIGAMTTIDEMFRSDELDRHFPVFRKVCRKISTQPVRNMATLGGNLACRYTWTEMPSVMIALEADLIFASRKNDTQEIPAEDFFQNGAKTDAILTHVRLRPDPAARVSYQRISKSPNVDLPLVSLCAKARIKDGQFIDPRIVVNNGAAFAVRDRTLEEFLDHAPAAETTTLEALDHLEQSIYDTRTDDYKKHILRVCVKNALMELLQTEKREDSP